MATLSTFESGTMLARPAPMYTDFSSADDRASHVATTCMDTPHFPVYNSMSLKPLEHVVKLLDTQYEDDLHGFARITSDNYRLHDDEQDFDVLACRKTYHIPGDEFAFAALPKLSQQASDSS